MTTPNANAPAPAPVPGSPEHDAAMIALADAQGVRLMVTDKDSVGRDVSGATSTPPADTPAVAQRPANVPEKFWDAAKGEVNTTALLQSYTELERARAAPAKPPVTPPATPPATPDPNASAPDQAQPPATPPSFQTLIDKAATEYSSGGALTDETVAALETAGIPKATAQNYINGLRAQAELAEVRVFEAAGGKDNYAAMQAWAAANMTPQQIEFHNEAVNSGQLDRAVAAVQTLKALHTAANGTKPTERVEPQGGANNGAPAEMYRSQAEMSKDMLDKRYKDGDKAFHAMVDRKLAAAMAAGIDLGF